MKPQILTIKPKNRVSQKFIVMEGSTSIADIWISSGWRYEGVLNANDVPYRVYREGLMSGAYVLASGGLRLAWAEKLAFFRHAFVIEYATKSITVRAQSKFGSGFVVRDGDAKVGLVKTFIEPQGPLSYSTCASAELPEGWPLEFKVFVICVGVGHIFRGVRTPGSAGGA